MAFDNVMVSPHVAGSTIEARENMGRIAAEQTLEILDGKKPPRLSTLRSGPLIGHALTRSWLLRAMKGVVIIKKKIMLDSRARSNLTYSDRRCRGLLARPHRNPEGNAWRNRRYPSVHIA